MLQKIITQLEIKVMDLFLKPYDVNAKRFHPFRCLKISGQIYDVLRDFPLMKLIFLSLLVLIST